MVSALGVNIRGLNMTIFALGAGLAGLAGLMAGLLAVLAAGVGGGPARVIDVASDEIEKALTWSMARSTSSSSKGLRRISEAPRRRASCCWAPVVCPVRIRTRASGS